MRKVEDERPKPTIGSHGRVAGPVIGPCLGWGCRKSHEVGERVWGRVVGGGWLRGIVDRIVYCHP